MRDVDAYFSRLARVRLVSAEELVELDEAIRQQLRLGDDAPPQVVARANAARQRYVVGYLRLVIHIFRKMRLSAQGDYLDALQTGALGLIRAAELYDPDRGAKYSTFATWWVRAFLRAWRARQLGSGLKTHAARAIYSKLPAAIRELRAGHIEPTPRALAEHLGADSELVLQVMLASGRRLDKSLFEPLAEGLELVDTIADDSASPEECARRSELHEIVREVAHGMFSPRELAIFYRRIFADDPATLDEIGRDYGLSKERVRQIEQQMLRKLRDALHRNKVEA